MKHPIKIDDLGGKPTILGNPHVIITNVNYNYNNYTQLS